MYKKIILFTFLQISLFSHGQGVELLRSFVGYNEKSEIISFTPEDEILLSGDFSGYINYWDVPNRSLISSIKAHQGKIKRIEFSINGEKFLTFSEDKHLKIWNFSSLTEIADYYVEATPSFAAFYDDESLLVGDKSGTVYLNNIYYPEKDSIFYDNNGIAIHDAILNESKTELVICDERSIKVLDLIDNKKVKYEIKNNYSSYFVKSRYYSPDVLMTWSQNGIVSFWDLNEKKLIRELRAKNDFHNLSINQYSKVLLTGYYKDKALLFDLNNLDLERELDENIELVNTYLTNDYQQFMISSSQEGRHRLMEVKGGDGIKPLSLQKRDVEVQKVVNVKAKILNLSVWDNERVDGDRISLSLNGRWILRNHEINKEKHQFQIELIPNQINQLIFFAENLGEIPPNTTALNIQYEGYNKTHMMRSNMEKSGSINFFFNEEE